MLRIERQNALTHASIAVLLLNILAEFCQRAGPETIFILLGCIAVPS
jgi:hypothetical protein